MKSRMMLASSVAVAVLAACQPAAQIPPQPIPAMPSNCNALSVDTCGLPYPSNQFSVPDATSPTGIRLKVSDDIVRSEVLDQLPASLRPERIYSGQDGFSAAGPIVFEFNGSINPSSVPQDGGTSIQVFDVANGKRVGIDVDVWAEAAERGGNNRIALVWPESRFPFGHTLRAYATRSITGAAGSLSSSPAVDTAVEQDSGGIASFAQTHGIQPGEILSFTEFTVRSQASATGPVDQMVALTRQEEHPVRNLQVAPNFLFMDGISSFVSGEVRSTEFRTLADGGIPKDLVPKPSWVQFLMTRPAHAPATGAPIVIYSHGLGIPKETMLLMAGQNAQLGMATISIDQPNHGVRTAPDGGYVFDLVTPSGLTRLNGLLQQSAVDHVALLRAIQTQLTTLDAAPYNLFKPLAADGRPDLDTARVFLEGTSLGGFVGTTFLAQAPEISGATFQVAGAGVLHTLSNSFFWKYGFSDKGGFRGVIPRGSTAGEAALLVAAAQFIVDAGDPLNFADRVGDRKVPFHLIYSDGDGTVNNASTRALLQLAGIPIYGRVLVPEPHLGYSPALPADGRGAWQISSNEIPQLGPLNDARALLTHATFMSEAAYAETGAWFRQRLNSAG